MYIYSHKSMHMCTQVLHIIIKSFYDSAFHNAYIVFTENFVPSDLDVYNSTVSSKSSDTFAAISSSLLDVIGSEPFWLKAVAVSRSSVSRSSREKNNKAHTCTMIKVQGLQYIDS